MAENQQDGQERTEDPTPKRLREAREKGNIPRSRELSTMMVTLTGAGGLMMFGEGISTAVIERLRASFSPRGDEIGDPSILLDTLTGAMVEGILALVPFFAVCMAAAMLGPTLLGGWNFSTKALAPKFEKLDPIKGFMRLFAPRNAVELLKAMAKFLLIGTVALLLLQGLTNQIIGLSMEPVRAALGHAVSLCLQSLLVMCASLAIIAAVDVPFQLWDYSRKMRMTLQEVRDEMKETDGRPEVKSKIRQVQQQLARRRMMEEVPQADVIVTNPTHVSVALKYDAEGGMSAPRVIAKGTDLIALRIREIATEHRVPIFEAPPLARALNAHADIGEEIPRPLYHAVAQVLSYVYALRRARNYEITTPEVPDINVPEDLTPPSGEEADD